MNTNNTSNIETSKMKIPMSGLIQFLQNNMRRDVKCNSAVCSHCEEANDESIEQFNEIKRDFVIIGSAMSDLSNKLNTLRSKTPKNKKDKKKINRKIDKLHKKMMFLEMKSNLMRTIIQCFENSCMFNNNNNSRNCRSRMRSTLSEFWEECSE